jgi:glutamate racemase
MTAQEYLKPVLAEHVDTLVLGCTHYPLLKPLLKDVVGPGIALIDSAVTVAEQTAQVLKGANLAHTGHGAAHIHYCVTDVPLRFQTVGERFLGRTLGDVEKVEFL